MNFLGHLWLADATRTSLAGAILGDFVKGPDLARFPAELALGIRLHRSVDRISDAHPAVLELRRSWKPPLRRYAPILIDLGLDHSLARDWDRLHGQALPDFSARAQQALLARRDWFPPPVDARLDGFARLLASYAQREGLQRGLTRCAERLRRPYDPRRAHALLDEARGELDAMIETVLRDVLAALQREYPQLAAAPQTPARAR